MQYRLRESNWCSLESVAVLWKRQECADKKCRRALTVGPKKLGEVNDVG